MNAKGKALEKASGKKKEYTGHYRLDTMGRTRALSPKAVAKFPK